MNKCERDIYRRWYEKAKTRRRSVSDAAAEIKRLEALCVHYAEALEEACREIEYEGLDCSTCVFIDQKFDECRERCIEGRRKYYLGRVQNA